MNSKTEVTIEEGSTNVYAGLGYADAAGMQRKSQLAGEIGRAIKVRRKPLQESFLGSCWLWPLVGALLGRMLLRWPASPL